MSNEVLVAIIAFCGTLVGTAGGIIASSKLTNYRIKKLEEKVDKHNMIIERTYVLEEKMKAANHRIEDLEKKVMM
jgi:ABC-type lipoprotein release transport system permease subunit